MRLGLKSTWADVSAWLVSGVDLEFLGLLDEVWDPVLGVTDEYGGG